MEAMTARGAMDKWKVEGHLEDWFADEILERPRRQP